MTKSASPTLHGKGLPYQPSASAPDRPPLAPRKRGVALPLADPPILQASSVAHRPQPTSLSSETPMAGDLGAPANGGATYEVGYGKPPRRTRFKKGQSGNPKGRSKGSKNLWTILQEEAQTVVAFSENGKPTKASKQALAIKSAVNKAVKGDLRALQIVLKLFEKYAPPSTDIEPGSSARAAALDRHEMDREILSMLGLADVLAPATAVPGANPADGKPRPKPKVSSD